MSEMGVRRAKAALSNFTAKRITETCACRKNRRRVESGDGFSLRAHTAATIAAWRKKQSAGAPAFDAIN